MEVAQMLLVLEEVVFAGDPTSVAGDNVMDVPSSNSRNTMIIPKKVPTAKINERNTIQIYMAKSADLGQNMNNKP